MNRLSSYRVYRAQRDGHDYVLALICDDDASPPFPPILLEVTRSKTIFAIENCVQSGSVVMDPNGVSYDIDLDFVFSNAISGSAISSAIPKFYAQPPGIRDWMALQGLVVNQLTKAFGKSGYEHLAVDYDTLDAVFVISGRKAATRPNPSSSISKGKGPKQISKRNINTYVQGKAV